MPTLQPLRPIARRALATQSDERLVGLLREGHAPAFEEIVRRYRGPLVGFAAAIVSADGAEDVVQASLTKAHSALLEDPREINLRPWLFAIVRNGALNAIRGEPRVDELDEALAEHSNPSDIAEQREDLDRLVVAMCALPDAQRQALVKRELEGVGHGEIAAQLGTTATAVRGLIFRARTQVRNAMGALVPLPLLRALLSQGTAIGAAGGGVGGGASAALLGGAGAKGGAAITAAVLALGTGIAIEGRKGDKDGDRSSVALAQGGNGAARPAGGNDSTPSAPTELASQTGKSGHASSSGSGPGDESGGGGSASSSGESGGDGSGSGHSGSSEGSGSGSGSSGSDGGGHGSPTVPPPADDDDSGHGGPGPSQEGDDDSGSDDLPDPPEVDDDSSGQGDEPEEPEVDSSGPGSGEESPSGSDDNSGHGGD